MKKVKKSVSKKRHHRYADLQTEVTSNHSHKSRVAQPKDTRMLGKQPKIGRINNPGDGLPKWRRQ
jgi:hypothetical protein